MKITLFIYAKLFLQKMNSKELFYIFFQYYNIKHENHHALYVVLYVVNYTNKSRFRS